MKDNEFIELLNLYLDHEISVEDAARLESEVQRNPKRYRVYREYCQMHKACALVSLAPSVEAPAVAEFEHRSSRWINPFAVGGLIAAAAAAAVAFAVLHRTPTAGPAINADTLAAAPVAAPATIVPQPTAPTVATTLDRSDRPSSVLATQTLRWNSEDLTAPRLQDVRFNWIESLELTAIPQVPSDSFRFESKMTQKETQRSFGPGASQSPSESNALQFQR